MEQIEATAITLGYENLVFKGGGVLGIAYTGAIDMLQKYGVLPTIKRVAGTSAGAITASLLAIGYTGVSIRETMPETFNYFRDKHQFLQFSRRFGWHSGKNFLRWLQSAFKKQGVDALLTFGQLEEMHRKNLADSPYQIKYRSLRVFAVELNTQTMVEFSARRTPDVPIVYAVRASMSVPFFFDAWQFPNNMFAGKLFTDGGLMFNFPISTFDEASDSDQHNIAATAQRMEAINERTLGFHLCNITGEKEEIKLKYWGSPIKFGQALVLSALNAQDTLFMNNSEETRRTVLIDNMGISSFDFSLDKQNSQRLILKGITATEKYLQEAIKKRKNG